MTPHRLQYKQATLRYTKTGNGKKVLFTFHGFGQTSQVFCKLSESLSADYTIYNFDLFFHGSLWNQDEQPLEKVFWNELIQKFISAEGIHELSVLGFSMGAKFALATLEAFPARVKEIFLLAPDGIKTNTWYSLATYPTALRALFKTTIKNPLIFNATANFAFRTRLIDKGVLRFVKSQMNTEEKRNRVYLSWVVFRHLHFSMRHISRMIHEHRVKLVVITGRFDKIITAKNMGKLLRHVPHARLEMLDTGHNGVIDGSIEILVNLNHL